MAIKGKKKNASKSGRKRPSAPKPVVVAPETPFLSRRWVQVCAAALIALIAGLGFGYGFGKQHKVNVTTTQKANAKAVVTEYSKKVDAALTPLGSVTQPGSFQAFPSIASGIAGLKKGTSSPGSVAKDAAAQAAAAKKAAGTINALNIQQLVGTKSVPDAVKTDMLNSQRRLYQAITIYGQAAQDLRDAALNGGPGSPSMNSAQNLATVAGGLFADGYTDYYGAQNLARYLSPSTRAALLRLQQQQQQQGAPGGLPTGAAPPVTTGGPQS